MLVHVSKQVEVLCSVYYTLYYNISKWSRSFTVQSMFQEGTIFLELWKWSILCCFESMLQSFLENTMNFHFIIHITILKLDTFKMVMWIIKCEYHINSSLHVIGWRGGTTLNVTDNTVN